ncbi:MAG: S8 family serine peptidase [Bacteroidota bacterium]
MRPFVFLLALVALPLAAQPTDGWHLAAPESGTPGIALDEAYTLLDGRTPREIIVAIIDSGVDAEHPDLAPVMWVNADEVAGNGVDDDENGYADDVHGWSFLGNASGENVAVERLEIARLVAACRAAETPTAECAGYEADFEAEVAEFRQAATNLFPVHAQLKGADSLLTARFPDAYDPAGDINDLDVGGDIEADQAKRMLALLAMQGATFADLDGYVSYVRKNLDYRLNPDFDPRPTVGDDPADLSERFYGNADSMGPDASHGTGVAGLVAAVRGNNIGIDGIAPNTAEAAPVRIMALRAVPDGDEYDKDIANAIRYAVDNGAHIINMSFGKGYSPDKSVVDEAAQYAAERGVLLVHAAGNDGKDLGGGNNFPTDVTMDGSVISTWLEIGASSSDPAELAASFSNYGDAEVDLFAPGAQVTSLAPGGETQTANGTSFAAPVVAGVAALVMAYVPELSAEEVRQILLDSATPFVDTQTPTPGGGEAVPFGTLSVTGGVVNAAEAVRLALERAGS